MSYHDSFDPVKNNRYAKRLWKIIKKHKIEFDSIVCTGTSGLTIAVLMSLKSNKPITYLRKPEDKGGGWIREPQKRFIIVDDLIDSGATVNRMLTQAGTRECVAILLCDAFYSDRYDWEFGDKKIPVYAAKELYE